MREFRKKQKRLFNIMKALIIFGAIFLFVYIGAEPFVQQFNVTLNTVVHYFSDAIVIAILVLVFLYYSKYGKSDSFLNLVEHEISDAGHYYTSRDENDIKDYTTSVIDDLKQCKFSIESDVAVDDFSFDYRAKKKNDFIYLVQSDDVDKNDIVAFIDCAIYDLTAQNLKRKGDAVVCFISENPGEDAISLSKMITPCGRKGKLTVAIAIIDVATKKAYFLGNMESKCQQLIVNHILNCELPLKDKYISQVKLPFQNELEEHMKDFNITDFKNGNFYAH